MIKIIMDTQEFASNPQLAKRILNLKGDFAFEHKSLEVGDLLVGNFLIEIKKTTDILTKNDDGSFHIKSQLDRLLIKRKQGAEVSILIEGKYSDAWNNRPYSKKKMIQSQIDTLEHEILFKYGIPIKKVDDINGSVRWIRRLLKIAKKPDQSLLSALRITPSRKMSMNEKLLYMLQGVKTVGPAKSVKLAKEFGSLIGLSERIDLIHDTTHVLTRLIGSKSAKELISVWKYEYKP